MLFDSRSSDETQQLFDLLESCSHQQNNFYHLATFETLLALPELYKLPSVPSILWNECASLFTESFRHQQIAVHFVHRRFHHISPLTLSNRGSRLKPPKKNAHQNNNQFTFRKSHQSCTNHPKINTHTERSPNGSPPGTLTPGRSLF